MTINPDFLTRLIEANFDVVRDRSNADELVFVCPVCADQTGNRSVNLHTGFTNCWRCQDKQPGHIVPWLQSRGVSMDDLGTGVGSQDLSSVVRDILSRPPRRGKGASTTVSLPKGFISVWDAMEQGRHKGACGLIAAMAREKNLTLEDLSEMGVGFVPFGSDPGWLLYAIFPVVVHGTVVYYQGRDLLDGSKKFPSRDGVGSGSASWVYNYDELREPSARKAIVVESILNVISLRKKFREQRVTGVVPVATFSAAISDRQRQLICSLKHLDEVTIFFDHDATDKAWRFAEECYRYARTGLSVSVAEMPAVCGPTSDPNDDSEAAFHVWTERQEFSPSSQALQYLRRRMSH